MLYRMFARMAPNGRHYEVYAQGIRNSEGYLDFQSGYSLDPENGTGKRSSGNIESVQ